MRNHDMLVLYGSQTGNAEDVAYRIYREASRRYKKAIVKACDQYDIQKLVEENFVLFVVSTTGQGDPPDNMKKFWRFIWKKMLPLDCLSHLSYAVIALGDSSYDQYNMVGKKLHRRVQLLGGREISPCCLGDDQHEFGYNAALNTWLVHFWQSYLVLNPMNEGQHVISPDVLLPSRFKVRFLSHEDRSFHKKNNVKETDYTNDHTHIHHHNYTNNTQNHTNNHTENYTNIPTNEQQQTNTTNNNTAFNEYCESNVLSNKRLTPTNHWQNVVLTTLDTTKLNKTFEPGDVCWLRPHNKQKDIKTFLKIMRMCGSSLFEWECEDFTPFHDYPLPNPCSLRILFSQHLELTALPRDYFWEVMANLRGESVCGGWCEDGENKDGGVNDVDGEINGGGDDCVGGNKDKGGDGVKSNDHDEDVATKNNVYHQNDDGKDKDVEEDEDDDDTEAFELEQERLREFNSYQSIDDLYDYCYRPRRNILEILADFPHSCRRLSLARLLEIIPPIKSRPFSIASSPLSHPKSLDLLVAVVNYKTMLSTVRLGLCSNYIASLRPRIDRVLIKVTKGTFKMSSILPKSTFPSYPSSNLNTLNTLTILTNIIPTTTNTLPTINNILPTTTNNLPTNTFPITSAISPITITSNSSLSPSTTTPFTLQTPMPSHFPPVVMVGPGTGCAPFRSLILQRCMLNIPENYMFYGCRSRKKDFFFDEEWSALQQRHFLFLFTAFSRDQEDKIYVQDILRENQKLIFDLLFNKNGCFLLAGSSKSMPEQVREAIEKIITNNLPVDGHDGRDYVNLMIKQGRYQSEVW